VLPVPRFEPSREPPEFTAPGAVVVVGRVLTASGKLAVGAELEARARPSSGMPVAGERARADGLGRFELRRMVAGELTIAARLGAEIAQYGPEPASAGDRKEVTIRLAPGARISGTVRFADGQPGVGVTVVASARSAVKAEAGADGSFSIGPFLPGEVSLLTVSPSDGGRWSFAPGGAGQSRFALAAGEHRTDVVLTAGQRASARQTLWADHPRFGRRPGGEAGAPDVTATAPSTRFR
jgi:hypothetical protein